MSPIEVIDRLETLHADLRSLLSEFDSQGVAFNGQESLEFHIETCEEAALQMRREFA